MASESETGLPANARRQSAVRAATEVRSHDGFQPRAQGLSEPGADHDPDCDRSALAGDITYIRLRDEFVFLAVILDAYSRRVIGRALDHTLEDKLPLAALGMAFTRRTVQPGLVHHSDRGSQCASNDYTDLLKAHQIAISMSGKGSPWDNGTTRPVSRL
jgi:transposase InsO family protein